MSRGAAIHLDTGRHVATLSLAFCGWLGRADADITKVTCKSCRKLFAKGSAPRVARAPKGKPGSEDKELDRLLAPKAPPPPALEPALWARTCKGAEHRRCGECELCIWETKEANVWGSVSVAAHNVEHRIQKSEGSPRWGSLRSALIALSDWYWHDRHSPSAMGGILARIKSGQIGLSRNSRPSDPLLGRYDDVRPVEAALERAYPEGGHGKLRAGACRALLLVRTPGVLVGVPTYEELARKLVVTEGDLRALVRSGRERVEFDLFERGLIPRPRERRGRGLDV